MAGRFDEKKLIDKAKAGDEASFELLIRNCSTRAYNTALRYLGSEEDAMDVLQESLIKVFRHLDSFKGDSKFDTWVYRIVINTCNDFLRKNKNHKANISLFYENEDGEGFIEIRDESPTPPELLDAKLTSSFILERLDEIPCRQKEIIILRDIQGFSYEEISEILDCSIGTVKSRLNRARAKLKQRILEQYDEIHV